MNSKIKLVLLTIVITINVVFLSFEQLTSILISIISIFLAVTILFIINSKSIILKSFLFVCLIFFQIIAFYKFSYGYENKNLKKNLYLNSKWTWNSDNVNYRISVKKDSIIFYDENEFIDIFNFKIENDLIYFDSKEGEKFIWKVLYFDKKLLKIKEDEEIITIKLIN
jgi:energy-coupling factor transporter transmembrane protein EcfT